jgi:tellurite resistance protein TerC
VHTQLPAWFEIGSFVVLGCILLFDLLLVAKRPHEPSMKEAGVWVGVYVALALVFGGLMFAFAGPEPGTQFIAGWVTEYSLSIDNLFVFIVIMARFSVPRKYQQEVLMVGIIIALVLRGIFILLGATIIANFSWVFYLFGVFLLWTAYHQAKDEGEDETGENALIRRLRTVVPMTEHYDGNKLRTVVGGKKLFTPMVIVFVTIGVTDLMFAFDSIPAIFGLTQSPFIVFTANIFALMGLRQLYFLLGGLMERLIYLKHGLSLILAFIGVKLILHAMHENEVPFINGGDHIAWAPEIPTFVSLGVIVAIIVLATIASMVSPKGRSAHAVAELHRAIESYRTLGEDASTGQLRAAQTDLVGKYRAARTASERSPLEVPDLSEHTGKSLEDHDAESSGATGAAEPTEAVR